MPKAQKSHIDYSQDTIMHAIGQSEIINSIKDDSKSNPMNKKFQISNQKKHPRKTIMKLYKFQYIMKN